MAALAERCFLNLWSYPNPYRSQGDGKEICDLLVVCENDVIIFSDKSIQFGDSGDLDLDWQRWFKKAVLDSANQLNGAVRWLSKHPEKIFVEKTCSQAFPLKIPDVEAIRFHLVVVASGSKTRCIQHFKSGSGSLLLKSDMKGKSAHIDKDHANYLPFAVGDIQPSKRFIHVLDEVTLDILLNELDTTFDFLEYMREKESFMRSGRSLHAAGEEELLAYYLRNTIMGVPGFTSPEELESDLLGPVFLLEGLWEGLKNDPQFILKKELDKMSELWDLLITEFTKNMLDGTSIVSDDDITIADIELAVRLMAQENRFKRRMLANDIIDASYKVREGERHFRCSLGDKKNLDGGTAYVFLQFSQPHKRFGKTYEEYRNVRQKMLYAYCINVKLKFPKLRYIVGIAMEPIEFYEAISEDILVIDIEDLTEELFVEAKQLAEHFSIMVPKNISHYKVDAQEYPSPD